MNPFERVLEFAIVPQMLQHVGRVDLGASFVCKEGQIIAVADVIHAGPRQGIEDDPTVAFHRTADVQFEASRRNGLFRKSRCRIRYSGMHVRASAGVVNSHKHYLMVLAFANGRRS